MRKIVVVAYRPEWSEAFRAEAARIAAVLGENLVAIHHIGSTSVPGLCAKPIIDILPVVRDIEVVDKCNAAFIALGYTPMGEFGIRGRRYFHKGGDERTHHVHVFAAENREAIERHLAVPAYLRAHPDEARAYGELKKALAARFPLDWEGYCDGKDEYVRALEMRALRWYRGRPA
ncbi:MAG TPA: GrpB family protein [Candidatus Pullichristensenella avicola]|nr:GrpB family protein [Candidatus Pullichristensenella avicola]